MVDVCDGSMGWPVGQAVGKGGEGHRSMTYGEGAIAIVIMTVFLGRARSRVESI